MIETLEMTDTAGTEETSNGYSATYSPEDNKLRLYSLHRLPAETYARVKAAGFKWAPKQDLFVAPMWTPSREDLLLELCGEIGDEDTSLVQRAEAKAERLEDLSERKQTEGQRAYDRSSEIAERFHGGQPILVGHHSEKRARKDQERIHADMGKAVNCWKSAEYWKDRAAGALHNAKYKELPAVRYRRIKTIESDLRKAEKTVKEAEVFLKLWAVEPLTQERAEAIANRCHISKPFPIAEYPRQEGQSTYEGDRSLWSALEGRIITPEQARQIAEPRHRGTVNHYSRLVEHYHRRIEYEGAMLDEQGGIAGETYDFKIGGRVLYAEEWSTITKVNKKDGAVISVSTAGRHWPRVKSLEIIQGYEPPTEEQAEKTAAALKAPPLCNYPGEGFATCTEEQWKKISSDYKSQSHRIEATETTGSHRVRWAMGVWLTLPSMPDGKDSTEGSNQRHRYYPVYVTDAKRKDPPSVVVSPAVPKIEAPDQVAPRYTPSVPKPKAEHLQQMETAKSILQTGVQIVAVPQLFPTPAALAARMVEIAEIENGMRICEPEAGTGNILKAIVDGFNGEMHISTTLRAIEINQHLAEALETRWHGYPSVLVAQQDFLEWEIDGEVAVYGYDRILMNPPFANGQDIAHITHAMKLLKPGGKLVAICANGPKQNDKLKPIIETAGGEWEVLPRDTFKESGTGVNTVLMTYTRNE